MSNLEFYRKLVKVMENGNEAYLATLTETSGSTPQKAGAKMLIFGDGSSYDTIGGGDVERKLIEDVLKRRSTVPQIIRYNLNEENRTTDDPRMMCGGSVTFYIEPVGNPNPLHIIGGGHCAVELSKLAASLDFSVTVIDNRPEWASKDKHPFASRVVHTLYDDIEKHIPFSPNAYFVIMTHGHQHDEQVLRICLKHEFRYIGVIGSHRKAKTIFDNLTSEGVSKTLLSRVHCPIGLDINTHTPAEIAVSIAAQLIAEKNGPPKKSETRA